MAAARSSFTTETDLTRVGLATLKANLAGYPGITLKEDETRFYVDANEVVIADARSPLGLSEAVAGAGGPADITVVCVDVPGCEQPAILSTAQGGTIIFFSMATSFAAAALGAEGAAADVRMLVGNGYVPGHAAYALDLIRGNAAVRSLFEGRLDQ